MKDIKDVTKKHTYIFRAFSGIERNDVVDEVLSTVINRAIPVKDIKDVAKNTHTYSGHSVGWRGITL